VNSTIFRDLTLLMLLGFVAMVMWMLPHLNPPEQDTNSEPPGNLIAHITWPEGDNDVDLWLLGPNALSSVGYSNKSGALWNLLRDDLGGSNDLTPLNYENAYTRGIIAGTYVLNVHCYRCTGLPIEVALEVSLSKKDGDKTTTKVLGGTRVTLHSNKQELTAMRFDLTKEGVIVAGSVNHIYEPLRNRK
jgi:hypothetical protein